MDRTLQVGSRRHDMKCWYRFRWWLWQESEKRLRFKARLRGRCHDCDRKFEYRIRNPWRFVMFYLWQWRYQCWCGRCELAWHHEQADLAIYGRGSGL